MTSSICAIGDVHGHLQLALCMAAIWQEELQTNFEAVFLCGDIGTFTAEEQLDSTTRRHGKTNPCELEFFYQWSATPFPEWLGRIFAPKTDGGLGLTCPVVMVHGNHEGFSHLVTLIPNTSPDRIFEISELPSVDTGGFIRYLPSGFRCRTDSKKLVGGIGGVELGQRQAKYHELAYLDETAILRFLEQPTLDLLITHQGPSALQADGGSPMLQLLLDAEKSCVWCHGHSIRNPEILDAGPHGLTRVVPLYDATFTKSNDEPGDDCFAWIQFGDDTEQSQILRGRPENWRPLRRKHWIALDEQRLVCPMLKPMPGKR